MKKQELSYKTIAPFLHTGRKRSRLIGYAGLCIGITLLLCSLQLFININQLLKEKSPRRNGYDFISVTKTITNENMGKDNRFSRTEVDELKQQDFIIDAAPLISNQFRAKASAGAVIPFSTDLFLESVKDDFLDTIPPSFSWQPGQTLVPVVFSADFLEMYNIFAPAQGLPQVSASSAGSLNIILECYGPSGMESYQGRIVALSDRINSVLVPEDFLQWANKRYGNSVDPPSSRIYIKAIDANDPKLLDFLDKKNYHINKDRTKFGRVKQVLQAVVAGMGGFAILVILLAMMLFSFYLQLMVARSKDNLQLLLTLGYSPSWLSGTVTRKWAAAYSLIIIVALAITAIFQYLFQRVTGGIGQSPFLHFSVPLLAVGLLLLCVIVNYRLVSNMLHRIGNNES